MVVNALGLPAHTPLVRSFFGLVPLPDTPSTSASNSPSKSSPGEAKVVDEEESDMGLASDLRAPSTDHFTRVLEGAGRKLAHCLHSAPEAFQRGYRAQLLEALAVLLLSHCSQRNNAAAGSSSNSNGGGAGDSSGINMPGEDGACLPVEVVGAVLCVAVSLRGYSETKESHRLNPGSLQAKLLSGSRLFAEDTSGAAASASLAEQLTRENKKRPIDDPVAELLGLQPTGAAMAWHEPLAVSGADSGSSTAATPGTSSVLRHAGLSLKVVKRLGRTLLDMLLDADASHAKQPRTAEAAASSSWEEPITLEPPAQCPPKRWVAIPRPRVPVALWLLSHLVLTQTDTQVATAAASSGAPDGTHPSTPPRQISRPTQLLALSGSPLGVDGAVASPGDAIRTAEISAASFDAAVSDGWTDTSNPPPLVVAAKPASANETFTKRIPRQVLESPAHDVNEAAAMAVSLQKAFPRVFRLNTPLSFPHLVQFFLSRFSSCWSDLAQGVVLDTVTHIYDPMVLK